MHSNNLGFHASQAWAWNLPSSLHMLSKGRESCNIVCITAWDDIAASRHGHNHAAETPCLQTLEPACLAIRRHRKALLPSPEHANPHPFGATCSSASSTLLECLHAQGSCSTQCQTHST